MIERQTNDGIVTLRLAHGKASALDVELCDGIVRELRDASNASAISFTAIAATSNGGNWLAISINAATTPATVTVSVNPAGIAPGYYNGIVSFVAPGVIDGHSFVIVYLNVSKPVLNLSTNNQGDVT